MFKASSEDFVYFQCRTEEVKATATKFLSEASPNFEHWAFSPRCFARILVGGGGEGKGGVSPEKHLCYFLENFGARVGAGSFFPLLVVSGCF
jgi:hypothetical protein